MRLAVVALLLIGCREPKDFDPLGGGGGSGMTGVPDAPPDTELDAPTGANLVTGRVCVVQDLRKLTLCDATNADDIAVEIGTAQVITATVNGTFMIDLPAGTGLTWKVSHPDFMTAISQLGTSFTLNTIRISEFSNLLSDNGVILTGGQSSSVVVQVLDTNDAPVVGATAVTSPAAQFQTRYDGNSATTWDQDATGAFGVAWLPGTTGTSTQLTVTPPGGGSSVTLTLPLVPDTITFATVSF